MKLLKKIKAYNQNRRIKKYKKASKELENTNFSIISSMCIGGIIYHDLGMEFTTPTINLRFLDYSFYDFCNHIKEYINAPIENATIDNGLITAKINVPGLPSISMAFPHDQNYEKIAQDWNRRKLRLNFNNIRVIAVSNIVGEKEKQMFLNIPYKNKILLYGKSTTIPCKGMVYNRFLKHEKSTTKRSIAGFANPFSIKRNFDSFDWLTFLKK